MSNFYQFFYSRSFWVSILWYLNYLPSHHFCFYISLILVYSFFIPKYIFFHFEHVRFFLSKTEFYYFSFFKNKFTKDANFITLKYSFISDTMRKYKFWEFFNSFVGERWFILDWILFAYWITLEFWLVYFLLSCN